MAAQNAIVVSRLSKSFKLPHEKHTSLKSSLVNFYRHGYEVQQVLDDISFQVKKGEFFGIVGRNGSGKSTLLKILASIYTPSRGEIQTIGKLTPFIELGVGFNPELTGRENVYLNGALLGFSRKEMSGLYDDIVKFAELERFMDQKLKNYSSGMQVRLAFSIAVQAKSDILLIDEVLAVGDAAFQRKCFDYFMELKKEGATVVLVTHDMNAVRQYCDRAILIEAGHIIKQGDQETVAEAYYKLFSTDSDKQKEITHTAEEDRWGNGKLQAVSTQVSVSRQFLDLTVRYKAKKTIDSPVLGFTIYNPSGINIMEGNTLRNRYRVPAMKAGDQVVINWQTSNIFADGKYTVSVACCDQSTTIFYDWLNRAASFNINRQRPTGSVINPEIVIKKVAANDEA